MKSLFLILFTILSALSEPAFGANLDSPARTGTTIRTELMRGNQIALGCYLAAGTRFELFYQCIESASQTQAQQGTGTKAFSLGLFFTAVLSAEIYYEDGRFTALAKSACQLYMLEIKKGEKALKLTDQELIKLFHMTDKALQTINRARIL
jgi:hypothetical protein